MVKKKSKKKSKKKATRKKKSTKKANHLTVVDEKEFNKRTALPSFDINANDIRTLNTTKLRDNMLRGIFALEGALFSQAGEQFNRVNKTREMIATIEAKLFKPSKFRSLSDGQKIKLYEILINNQQDGLKFLQSLHQNVASGLETVNKIEGLKKPANLPTESKDSASDKALQQVKNMLLEKIKVKAKEALE